MPDKTFNEVLMEWIDKSIELKRAYIELAQTELNVVPDDDDPVIKDLNKAIDTMSHIDLSGD